MFNKILITTIFSFLITNFASSNVSNQKCIKSNGIPNHEIGKFPTRGNPHKFQKQNIKLCFTKQPIKTSKKTFRAKVSGITLTGIPIRPGTADWYDKNSPRKHSKNKSSGLNLEAIRPFEKIFGIDNFNGHVDHRGLYHYHKVNPSLLIGDKHLIGYAADGFEILYMPKIFVSSWRLKKAERMVEPFGKFDGSFKEDYEYVEGVGNLDECNGAMYKGKFRYFATDRFPFFPRCHWGKVSEDFIVKKRK